MKLKYKVVSVHETETEQEVEFAGNKMIAKIPVFSIELISQDKPTNSSLSIRYLKGANDFEFSQDQLITISLEEEV